MVKAGRILDRLRAKDGREVVLRYPAFEDVDDYLELINSLADEDAPILHTKRLERDEEVQWLGKALIDLERGKRVMICAEVEGKVVANCDLTRRSGARSHTGEVGLVVRRGFRDLGIGTALLRLLVDQARGMGIELLVLGVFAGNERARHVYEKVGFREVGCIPREFLKNGRYIDHVRMVLQI